VNRITEAQNEPEYLRLMRARSRVYQEAQWYQYAQLTVVIFIPIIAAVVGLTYSASRPYAAAISLAATVLDALWLDRAQRTRTKTGARLGEMVDCGLFQLDWNKFVAGEQVDALTVASLEQRWSGGDKRFIDWYKPQQLSELPIHVARVICQHSNLWYDGQLRRKVGNTLMAGTVVIGGILCVIGIILGLPFSDFILTVVAPVSPILTWACREYHRQRDTADLLDSTKASADGLWTQVLQGSCVPAECTLRSREFQDAIFTRRANSPLHVPLAYRLLRPRMESAMESGANVMLRQYQDANS
jgi:membrane protein implicated in regulation of membrane protease activity